MKNSGQDLSDDGHIETKVKEMTKTAIEQVQVFHQYLMDQYQ